MCVCVVLGSVWLVLIPVLRGLFVFHHVPVCSVDMTVKQVRLAVSLDVAVRSGVLYHGFSSVIC